ncbi:pyridoxamine 5'-phosphate oxidase family protein [Alteromonas gilva]|uniref:Pyridoxamine 5'-phosphate oxidase family protein n=1 Tax=Alteromonas gilva TaxID=2987522 RepID=A0ABT5L4D7_9ALTE|nr:pyridoxamine 5'-phosphate oxidase family protein [Alteromonas gilva]MDC8831261.1 pyridoxamine 5'-phosphate oxidase family protein [Alteromonas gilva]
MSDWHSLLDSSLRKTRDEPQSRYFQLATVDAKGRAQNRTVVCRTFAPQQDTIWFISDIRSAKFAELTVQPNAAVCWYFTTTREQYRLNVTATIHTPETGNALCAEYWQSLSRAGRQQFLWGQPAAPRTHPEQPLQVDESDPDAMPAHFCVVALQVTEVDYLNLKGNPQQRQRFVRQGSRWLCKDLIP